MEKNDTFNLDNQTDANQVISIKFEAYTIFTVVLIFSGLLKLYVYYKIFHISILPFIDISEIFIQSFDNVVVIVLFFAINFYTLFILFDWSKLKQYLNHDLTGKVNLHSAGMRLKALTITSICLFLMAIIAILLRDSKNSYELILWILFLIWILWLNPKCIIFFYTLLRKLNIRPAMNDFFILFFTLNFFILVILLGVNEGYKVKNKSFYAGTIVTFKDGSSEISTKDHYFIGSTKNYCIFYNSLLKSTSISPMSEVKEITFSK
jgi:hypothetical protein